MMSSVLLFALVFNSVHPAPSDAMRKAVSDLISNIDSTSLTSKPSLKFLEGLEDITVNAGGNVTLHCNVGSTPSAVIYWEKDGKRIQGDDELNLYEKVLNSGRKIVESGIVASSFNIPCASRRHAGSYKCVAYNGHNIIESIAHVTVAGKNVKCPSNYRSAPNIVMSTESRFELEGNSATLVCRADRKAHWAWSIDGQMLNLDDDHYELLPNGDLLIRKIKWSDMGSYYCIASNNHGESRMETFLYPTKKKTA